MSEALKLLPCPFCGEKRIALNGPSNEYRYGCINCPACMAFLPGAVSDEAELIACWNTRPATPSDGAREALAKLIAEDCSNYMRCDGSGPADRAYALADAILARAPVDARTGRDATIEECASVEVRGDVETEAQATNPFQEGYAVGYQDTVYRFRQAIRSLALPSQSESDEEFEKRLDRQEAGENLRLLDYIADKIGVPHDEELSRDKFNSWFAALSVHEKAEAETDLQFANEQNIKAARKYKARLDYMEAKFGAIDWGGAPSLSSADPS